MSAGSQSQPTNDPQTSEEIFVSSLATALHFDPAAPGYTLSVFLAGEPSRSRGVEYRRLNMSNGLRDHFAAMVLEKLQTVQQNGHEVQPYIENTVIDADRAVVTHLDLAALTNSDVIHNRLSPLQNGDSVTMFDAGERPFLKTMRFYVIAVRLADGTEFFCIRSRTWVKTFETNRSIIAAMTTGEYNKYDLVEDKPLVFDEGLDLFLLGSDLFVINNDVFDKVFPKFEPVLAKVEDVVAQIHNRFPIQGLDNLVVDCKRDARKIGKLNAIITSEHLQHLDFTKLQATCARHNLGDIVQPDGKGGFKIVYDAQQKWKLLKLLNDDYVSSLATDTNYEITGGKRRT